MANDNNQYSGQYKVSDTNALIDSAGNLATYAQNLVNYVNSLNTIHKTVSENWINSVSSTGKQSDVGSYLIELQSCIDKLTNAIIPSISKFSETMYSLAIATEQTASNTVSGS